MPLKTIEKQLYPTVFNRFPAFQKSMTELIVHYQ